MFGPPGDGRVYAVGAEVFAERGRERLYHRLALHAAGHHFGDYVLVLFGMKVFERQVFELAPYFGHAEAQR